MKLNKTELKKALYLGAFALTGFSLSGCSAKTTTTETTIGREAGEDYLLTEQEKMVLYATTEEIDGKTLERMFGQELESTEDLTDIYKNAILKIANAYINDIPVEKTEFMPIVENNTDCVKLHQIFMDSKDASESQKEELAQKFYTEVNRMLGEKKAADHFAGVELDYETMHKLFLETKEATPEERKEKVDAFYAYIKKQIDEGEINEESLTEEDKDLLISLPIVIAAEEEYRNIKSTEDTVEQINNEIENANLFDRLENRFEKLGETSKDKAVQKKK